MKKIFTILAAAMLLAAPAANAQAFLNKLKDKAEKAIGGVISDKIGAKMEAVKEKTSDKINDKMTEVTGVDVRAMDSQGQTVTVVRPEEQLQRRRTSEFGWDGKVSPTTAKFPIPLMNEFPAVPSAQELANPTEGSMIAYYNAIKKVTLRAEELNADTTCEDEFAKEWRAKQEKKLIDAFGLTQAEWDAYSSGNMSDAQKEAIEKKMLSALFGGADIEKLAANAEADMKKMENMSDAEIQAEMQKKTIGAMMAVYREDPAETKYVTGMTPAELEKAITSEMEYQAQQLSKGNRSGKPGPVGQKMENYQKEMTAKDGAAYTKREKALEAKVKAASEKAARSMMGGLGALADAFSGPEKFAKKAGVADIQAAEKKYYNASKPMFNALSAGSDVDAKFSAAEKKKVQGFKDRIYASNNPSEYNPLFLQAIEAIKTYRLRAAALWSAAVQKRFDNVKAQMPEYIKVQRQAVEDGIIPECALWRAPLNVVIEAGDILEEAYSEFPCDYPHMYLEEVEREIKLAENESMWWPEFYASQTIDEIISGKNLYKWNSTESQIYKFNAGKWNPVAPDFDQKKLANVKEPVSATWRSSDGKREVIYNAEGHWLQLPEGDVVNPMAIQKIGNDVVWVDFNYVDNQDGSSRVQVVKCTYKL